MRNILVAFILFGLLGCAATLPPPKPSDPQRAIVGISLKTRTPIKLSRAKKVDRVYFIRMNEEDDPFSKESFIMSNYIKGDQAYILNAKPGRYAAVACYRKECDSMVNRTYEYTTFFSKEIIKLMEVTVVPGTITFMGEYVVGESFGFKDADDAQLHYFQLIAPGVNPRFLIAAIFDDNYYKGSLHEEKHDQQAEFKFLTKAKKHFKGTGWERMIKNRLEEIEIN